MSRKITKLANLELEERQNDESTYKTPLDLNGDDVSMISDFLFDHNKNFTDSEADTIIDKNSIVKSNYDLLVVSSGEVSKKEFWERYMYRCDKDRIVRRLETLSSTEIKKLLAERGIITTSSSSSSSSAAAKAATTRERKDKNNNESFSSTRSSTDDTVSLSSSSAASLPTSAKTTTTKKQKNLSSSSLTKKKKSSIQSPKSPKSRNTLTLKASNDGKDKGDRRADELKKLKKKSSKKLITKTKPTTTTTILDNNDGTRGAKEEKLDGNRSSLGISKTGTEQTESKEPSSTTTAIIAAATEKSSLVPEKEEGKLGEGDTSNLNSDVSNEESATTTTTTTVAGKTKSSNDDGDDTTSSPPPPPTTTKLKKKKSKKQLDSLGSSSRSLSSVGKLKKSKSRSKRRIVVDDDDDCDDENGEKKKEEEKTTGSSTKKSTSSNSKTCKGSNGDGDDKEAEEEEGLVDSSSHSLSALGKLKKSKSSRSKRRIIDDEQQKKKTNSTTKQSSSSSGTKTGSRRKDDHHDDDDNDNDAQSLTGLSDLKKLSKKEREREEEEDRLGSSAHSLSAVGKLKKSRRSTTSSKKKKDSSNSSSSRKSSSTSTRVTKDSSRSSRKDTSLDNKEAVKASKDATTSVSSTINGKKEINNGDDDGGGMTTTASTTKDDPSEERELKQSTASSSLSDLGTGENKDSNNKHLSDENDNEDDAGKYARSKENDEEKSPSSSDGDNKKSPPVSKLDGESNKDDGTSITSSSKEVSNSLDGATSDGVDHPTQSSKCISEDERMDSASEVITNDNVESLIDEVAESTIIVDTASLDNSDSDVVNTTEESKSIEDPTAKKEAQVQQTQTTSINETKAVPAAGLSVVRPPEDGGCHVTSDPDIDPTSQTEGHIPTNDEYSKGNNNPAREDESAKDDTNTSSVAINESSPSTALGQNNILDNNSLADNPIGRAGEISEEIQKEQSSSMSGKPKIEEKQVVLKRPVQDVPPEGATDPEEFMVRTEASDEEAATRVKIELEKGLRNEGLIPQESSDGSVLNACTANGEHPEEPRETVILDDSAPGESRVGEDQYHDALVQSASGSALREDINVEEECTTTAVVSQLEDSDRSASEKIFEEAESTGQGSPENECTVRVNTGTTTGCQEETDDTTVDAACTQDEIEVQQKPTSDEASAVQRGDTSSPPSSTPAATLVADAPATDETEADIVTQPCAENELSTTVGCETPSNIATARGNEVHGANDTSTEEMIVQSSAQDLGESGASLSDHSKSEVAEKYANDDLPEVRTENHHVVQLEQTVAQNNGGAEMVILSDKSDKNSGAEVSQARSAEYTEDHKADIPVGDTDATTSGSNIIQSTPEADYVAPDANENQNEEPTNATTDAAALSAQDIEPVEGSMQVNHYLLGNEPVEEIQDSNTEIKDGTQEEAQKQQNFKLQESLGGFFKVGFLGSKKEAATSLESQRQQQQDLIKARMRELDLDLDDAVESQKKTQEFLVQESLDKSAQSVPEVDNSKTHSISETDKEAVATTISALERETLEGSTSVNRWEKALEEDNEENRKTHQLSVETEDAIPNEEAQEHRKFSLQENLTGFLKVGFAIPNVEADKKLESERQLQQNLIKARMKELDLDLDDAVDSQKKTQELLVQDSLDNNLELMGAEGTPEDPSNGGEQNSFSFPSLGIGMLGLKAGGGDPCTGPDDTPESEGVSLRDNGKREMFGFAKLGIGTGSKVSNDDRSSNNNEKEAPSSSPDETAESGGGQPRDSELVLFGFSKLGIGGFGPKDQKEGAPTSSPHETADAGGDQPSGSKSAMFGLSKLGIGGFGSKVSSDGSNDNEEGPPSNKQDKIPESDGEQLSDSKPAMFGLSTLGIGGFGPKLSSDGSKDDEKGSPSSEPDETPEEVGEQPSGSKPALFGFSKLGIGGFGPTVSSDGSKDKEEEEDDPDQTPKGDGEPLSDGRGALFGFSKLGMGSTGKMVPSNASNEEEGAPANPLDEPEVKEDSLSDTARAKFEFSKLGIRGSASKMPNDESNANVDTPLSPLKLLSNLPKMKLPVAHNIDLEAEKSRQEALVKAKMAELDLSLHTALESQKEKQDSLVKQAAEESSSKQEPKIKVSAGPKDDLEAQKSRQQALVKTKMAEMDLSFHTALESQKEKQDSLVRQAAEESSNKHTSNLPKIKLSAGPKDDLETQRSRQQALVKTKMAEMDLSLHAALDSQKVTQEFLIKEAEEELSNSVEIVFDADGNEKGSIVWEQSSESGKDTEEFEESEHTAGIETDDFASDSGRESDCEQVEPMDATISREPDHAEGIETTSGSTLESRAKTSFSAFATKIISPVRMPRNLEAERKKQQDILKQNMADLNIDVDGAELLQKAYIHEAERRKVSQ